MPVRALMPPGQPRVAPVLWFSVAATALLDFASLRRTFVQLDHVSGLDHGQWRLSTLSSTAMAAPLVGRQVEISGLASRPELNQRVGTAQSFNEDTGRALCTV